MTGKTPVLAALALAAGLYGGTAMAGHNVHGYASHGRGYGHVDHRGYGYGHDSRRGYGYGHSNRIEYRGYVYRPPVRVVQYSRYVVHRHDPYCGHAGYGGFTRYDHYYSPYARYYDRDYGHAAFSGYSDGVGYRLDFDY